MEIDQRRAAVPRWPTDCWFLPWTLNSHWRTRGRVQYPAFFRPRSVSHPGSISRSSSTVPPPDPSQCATWCSVTEQWGRASARACLMLHVRLLAAMPFTRGGQSHHVGTIHPFWGNMSLPSNPGLPVLVPLKYLVMSNYHNNPWHQLDAHDHHKISYHCT